MYFEQSGKTNTIKTLECAARRAEELDIREIVIASTTGESAFKALEVFRNVTITAVTYHCGCLKPFTATIPDENRKKLENSGVKVIMASHALSGLEKSLAKRYSGSYPALLIGDTLRLFGQGTKVAVEVAVMAADGGALTGGDIISIGGTMRGADTALLITPVHQSNFFDMKIHEVICKPRFF